MRHSVPQSESEVVSGTKSKVVKSKTGEGWVFDFTTFDLTTFDSTHLGCGRKMTMVPSFTVAMSSLPGCTFLTPLTFCSSVSYLPGASTLRTTDVWWSANPLVNLTFSNWITSPGSTSSPGLSARPQMYVSPLGIIGLASASLNASTSSIAHSPSLTFAPRLNSQYASTARFSGGNFACT